MFSTFAPWDVRSVNMQRGGDSTVDRTVLIILDTRRLFSRFGWRINDCGIWLSEAGACIPQVLSIDEFCKQIVIMNLRNVKVVLSRAKQGDAEVDSNLPVGQFIYDSKFKEESYDIVGVINNNDAKGFTSVQECRHMAKKNKHVSWLLYGSPKRICRMSILQRLLYFERQSYRTRFFSSEKNI